jgi:hypothetical protein
VLNIEIRFYLDQLEIDNVFYDVAHQEIRRFEVRTNKSEGHLLAARHKGHDANWHQGGDDEDQRVDVSRLTLNVHERTHQHQNLRNVVKTQFYRLAIAAIH